MKQVVVILRGTPSSGKSTIAKKLRNFEEKIAWLKVDNFKDFFADDASDALPFVNGSANSTLEYLLKNGFSVVVDGIFQETTAIDDAVEIAKKVNIPTTVFELDASLETLKQRDKIREGVSEGHRKVLADETIEAIFNKLVSSSYPVAVHIDVEKNNLDQCALIIKEKSGL